MARVQLLHSADAAQVVMICIDLSRVLGPFKVMSLFLEVVYNRKQLLVIYLVVAFCGLHLPRHERNRVPLLILEQLTQDP